MLRLNANKLQENTERPSTTFLKNRPSSIFVTFSFQKWIYKGLCQIFPFAFSAFPLQRATLCCSIWEKAGKQPEGGKAKSLKKIKVSDFSPLQDNFVSLILPELIGWGWILLFPGASRPGEQRPEPSQKAFSPRNFLGARSRRSFLRARTSQRQPHSDALPAKQPLLKHW